MRRIAILPSQAFDSSKQRKVDDLQEVSWDLQIFPSSLISPIKYVMKKATV